jgi:hypothetical protein
MSEPASIFEFDGKYFQPTEAALGPWHANGLHGGAVSALLARSLESDGYMITRLTMDLVRRVPREALTIKVGEESGSSRIRRQNADLWAGDTLVAQARALKMLSREIDIPEAAVEKQVWDISDVALPEHLTEREKQRAQKNVGYPNFSSHALAIRFAEGSFLEPGPVTLWTKLVLPLVAGESLTPLQRAAAAADYASSGATGVLPYKQWSFMNTDLTVHLSRLPVGDWIAVSSRVSSQKTGIGLSEATLHDAVAPFGRSTQSLFIEPAQR